MTCYICAHKFRNDEDRVKAENGAMVHSECYARLERAPRVNKELDPRLEDQEPVDEEDQVGCSECLKPMSDCNCAPF